MNDFKYAGKPEEIPELFVKYWNLRNAGGIADLFINDAEFVNVVGIWWHDKDAIRRAHDYGLRVIFNKPELKVLKTKVMNVEKNIAVVHAKMRLTDQTPHGDVNTPHKRRNIFTFVLKNFDGRWKCLAAHNTDIVPGKETNIAGDEGIKAVDYRSG